MQGNSRQLKVFRKISTLDNIHKITLWGSFTASCEANYSRNSKSTGGGIYFF